MAKESGGGRPQVKPKPTSTPKVPVYKPKKPVPKATPAPAPAGTSSWLLSYPSTKTNTSGKLPTPTYTSYGSNLHTVNKSGGGKPGGTESEKPASQTWFDKWMAKSTVEKAGLPDVAAYGLGNLPTQDYWVPGYMYPYFPPSESNPLMLHNPYTDAWKPLPPGQAGGRIPAETTEGGGGGGGGGEEGIPPEPLGTIAWWGPDAITPYLRPWAAYLRELLEANRASAEAAIGLPFESFVPGTGTEDIPGMKSPEQMVKRIQELLKLSFNPGDTKTQKWQKFVTSISGIKGTDIETQQLLSSLRYGNTGWSSLDIGMLQHPSYT